MSQARTTDEERSAESTTERISVGHELRRAREVRGIGLRELADETRIALRHLEALEQDRLDDLPGRLYARNFVKSIAAALGADEQELLDYFDYQCQQADAGRASQAEGPAEQAARRRLALAALAVAALIIVATLTFSLMRGAAGPEDPAGARAAAERMPPPAEASEPSAAPSSRPVVSAREAPVEGPVEPAGRAPSPRVALATPEAEPSAPAPETVPPPAAERSDAPALVEAEPAPPPPAAAAVPADAPAPPLVLLTFTGPSWVEIEREGISRPIMGLKTAGEELSFPLDRAVEIDVANSGNVELTLDGRPAKPLGGPGERRRLRLDESSWRSLLR